MVVGPADRAELVSAKPASPPVTGSSELQAPASALKFSVAELEVWLTGLSATLPSG